ncbi:hypothetical protein UACE39S_05885 [Ureibacillus acetophenoni]
MLGLLIVVLIYFLYTCNPRLIVLLFSQGDSIMIVLQYVTHQLQIALNRFDPGIFLTFLINHYFSFDLLLLTDQYTLIQRTPASLFMQIQ